MSDPADSAGVPGEATGAADAADSAPDLDATGQEQGDQSSKRINGLMSLAQRRTAERDAALGRVDILKAQLAQYETDAVAEEPGGTQIELMYPERFAEGDQGAPEGVDPMAPPEPPTILFDRNNPSRSQNMPLGDAPVIGNNLSPAARYQQDQAQIQAKMRQLNSMGSQWVDQAKQSGLIGD